MNSTVLPDLNKSALLTLFNLSFVNPIILRDGVECSPLICNQISYVDGDLIFNVSHFTTYSVSEGLYCGDNACNNGESCSSCSTDCGSCSSGGSSSGGGGGGGGSRQNILPSLDDDDVIDTKLLAKEIINVPNDAHSGDIPKTEEEVALFDIGVEFTTEDVTSMDQLVTKIMLINFGAPGLIDVEVIYNIKDKEGKVLYEETETVPVEIQTEYLKSFNLSGLEEEEYILSLELVYAGQKEEAKAEAMFVVGKPIKKSLLSGAMTALSGATVAVLSRARWLPLAIIIVLAMGGASFVYYYVAKKPRKHASKKTKARRKKEGKSVLVITSVEKINSNISKTLKTHKKHPCIYVSLNKTPRNIKSILKKKKIDVSKLYFIDCVSENKKYKDVIHASPDKLDQLSTAVKSFIDTIEGEKILIVDTLATLLAYNNQNKVAKFVNKITAYASQNEVTMVALSPKTHKGEELSQEIFNFFDEVKKK